MHLQCNKSWGTFFKVVNPIWLWAPRHNCCWTTDLDQSLSAQKFYQRISKKFQFHHLKHHSRILYPARLNIAKDKKSKHSLSWHSDPILLSIRIHIPALGLSLQATVMQLLLLVCLYSHPNLPGKGEGSSSTSERKKVQSFCGTRLGHQLPAESHWPPQRLELCCL